MNFYKIATLVPICLAACAVGPQARTVWTHNSFSGQPAQARFITDRAECAAYATRLAPLPQEPRAQLNPAYQEMTILTPTGPVLGLVQNNQPNYIPSLSDYSNYENAKNAAISQQRQLFGACMYQRDWRAEEVVLGTQPPATSAPVSSGSGGGPFTAESRGVNQSCNSNSDCVGQLRCEYGRCKVP
jgi:hypothetical protein